MREGEGEIEKENEGESERKRGREKITGQLSRERNGGTETGSVERLTRRY